MHNAANQGHSFASTFLARYGQPSDPIAAAELAASLTALKPADRETFIDRAIGHFVNVAAGTSGR